MCVQGMRLGYVCHDCSMVPGSPNVGGKGRLISKNLEHIMSAYVAHLMSMDRTTSRLNHMQYSHTLI